MPKELPGRTYPEHWEKWKAGHSRSMKWRGHHVHLSLPCAGQYVGLEEIHDGIWYVYYGNVRIGTSYEKDLRIVDTKNGLETQKCKRCCWLLTGRARALLMSSSSKVQIAKSSSLNSDA